MSKIDKLTARIIIDALIERFDDLQDETGKDFSDARKVIIRFARNHKLFEEEQKE